MEKTENAKGSTKGNGRETKGCGTCLGIPLICPHKTANHGKSEGFLVPSVASGGTAVKSSLLRGRKKHTPREAHVFDLVPANCIFPALPLGCKPDKVDQVHLSPPPSSLTERHESRGVKLEENNLIPFAVLGFPARKLNKCGHGSKIPYPQ